jgi:hypothetical protein
VETRCFENSAHPLGGLLESAVRPSQDRRRAARGLDEAEQDAKRRRLAGSVRAQESGDSTTFDGEVEVVDRDRLAKPLGESVDLDDRQARPPSARADATTSFG